MESAGNLGAVQMGAALIALAAILLRWSAGDALGALSLGGISISFLVIATLAALVTLVGSPAVSGR